MEKEEIILKETKTIKVPVVDEMKKSFIAYAMAVNVSRAIPDVRDGLKPVHRRILYSMSELGLFNEKPHRKCARIVGDVLGKYHPHGDSAVYDALVRLAQDFTMQVPLVDGHGNFGSVDGDPAAAQRYTEARLSKIAGELLRDIDKECVDFSPNFDDTLMQPTVLPARYPNLLVNGADGIAVGMATSIPPHNLGEVIDGVIALINNPDIDIDELMNYVRAPDFPTGGIIMGRMGIRQAYKTGRGKVITRAKCEIEEDEKRMRIVVSEIPYQVNKSDLIMQIASLVKDKKIEGIADLKEESDREGMRVVIDIKRDANPQVVLNLLYKHSQLQTSSGIIFLSLVNGEPKVLNLKEMLFYYLEHQKQIILRRSVFDLEKAKERAHIVDGLVIALGGIERVVKIIRSSKERAEAMEKLQAELSLSEKQANAILDMRLVRLTALEANKLETELAELQAFCAEMESIIASPNKILSIIAKELLEIKEKYSTPRRTQISHDVGSIDLEDLIAREDMVVSMTNQGYIKRMAVSEYKAQNRGGVGIAAHKTKDSDFVNKLFIANTHDNLLFFTNRGRVFSIKTYEVPESSRVSKGRAIVNLLQIDQDEQSTAVICKSSEKSEQKQFLIMATRNGFIKKTPIEEFDRIMKVGKKAIVLDEGDELISVQISNGENDILIASTNGKCIRFSEKNVRAMGRGAHGVRAMRLLDGAKLVDMSVVREGAEILTITEQGFGKRVKIENYRRQSRGGIGLSAGKLTDKTGPVIGVNQINIGDDILLITNTGTTIRTNTGSLRLLSRTAMGVRMMKLRAGNSIVSVATIPPEEEETPIDVEEVAKEVQSVQKNVDGVMVLEDFEKGTKTVPENPDFDEITEEELAEDLSAAEDEDPEIEDEEIIDEDDDGEEELDSDELDSDELDREDDRGELDRDEDSEE